MSQPVDLKKMLEAGVHFGHRTSRWSPKMRSFIWGTRNKIHLLDVSKTAFLLERAGKFLKTIASEGKSVLWVGTKKAAAPLVLKAGETLEMPRVLHRWIGGTLSNFEQVKKAITRLLHLKDVIQKPLLNYKKKEIGMLQKEVERLEKNVGGIVDLDFPPAALIIIDAKKEATAVKEANRLGIPVIAVVDTNTDPSGVDYIIPANDDSPRSITFVIDYLVTAALDGKAAFAALPPEQQEAFKSANRRAARAAESAERAERGEKRGRQDMKSGRGPAKPGVRRGAPTTGGRSNTAPVKGRSASELLVGTDDENA